MKLPTEETEIMVSEKFAAKNNLTVGSKISTGDMIETMRNPTGASTKEYTVTGTFTTSYSGSQANSAILIGGNTLEKQVTDAAQNKTSGDTGPYFQYLRGTGRTAGA